LQQVAAHRGSELWGLDRQQVLHPDLGEDRWGRVGADVALEHGDRATAAGRLPRATTVVGLAGRAGQQTGAIEHLGTDGEPHVALPGLDRHDRGTQRGGTGRAGVDHVVDGDAGLADLLLQLLADGMADEVAVMSRIVTPPSWSALVAASAARSMTSLSGCLPNLVM
jgi:hypothetical protein